MKLSIITVCKNVGLSIEKTIESVINQTFTDFEYIVIDGASTDRTNEIIQKFKGKINKYISEPDKGIYDAMNKGIKLSEGEYLLFLNAGDYFVNSNVLLKIFSYELKADIIYGKGIIEFPNGFLFIKSFPSKITKTFMYYDTIPHQDALSKRNVFLTQKGFDESYKIAGDYEFFLKALYKNNFRAQFIPEFISINDLKGISRQKKYKSLTKKERLRASMKYYNKYLIYIYELLKPEYFIFIKYPKYIFDLFLSIFLRLKSK